MLTAKEGCCEEASPLSHGEYVPCNKPAIHIVKTKDPKPYRMCGSCSGHNVDNRGAVILGPFVQTQSSDEIDVLDMAAADAGHEESLAETNLGQLSNLVSQLKDARADHLAAVEAEREAKAVVHNLEQRSIPDLMRELRVKKYTMDDGSVVSLKQDATVSIPADRREDAYDWAEEQGHQGIVKTEVSVAFGKGEFDDAKDLVKKMATVTNRPVELGRSIHASTLKSFVKGILETVADLKADGKPIPEDHVLPEDLFTVFELFKVDVKSPKKK